MHLLIAAVLPGLYVLIPDLGRFEAKEPTVFRRVFVDTHEQRMLAQTGQRRSDRVVGFWRSSSGVELTLAYTGRPESLMIQVYPHPKHAEPHLVYTATWLSDNTFWYIGVGGSRLIGEVHASAQAISIRGADGWSAEWTRRR